MTDIRGMAAQTTAVSRSVEGRWTALRMTRDGAPIFLPWYQACVMEGRVFQAANQGTALFTGATLLAHASYADTAKSIFVDIPDGTAAIPVEVFFNFLATGAAIVHYAAYTSGILNGTAGTETAITPVNLNLFNPYASGATAAHTADTEADTITAQTDIVILDRMSTNQDLDAVGIRPSIRWSLEETPVSPIIVDAGSINVNGSPTTSGTGFGHVTWIELTEAAFS